MSVWEMSVCEMSVCEMMCEMRNECGDEYVEEEPTEEKEAAGAELKTKTPHNDVGKNKNTIINN